MIWSKMITLLACSVGICSAEWPTYHGGADLRGFSESVLPQEPVLRWRFNAGGAVDSTPVSDGERIYFAGRKGMIFALDLNGSNVWKTAFTRTNDAGQKMPVRFDASPVCSEGVVVAGSVRGVAYGMDAATGEMIWDYDSEGTLVGSPNVVDGQVLLLDQSEGSLHALELKTGKLLWKTEPIERCDGVPGIGKNHIVFGSCLAAFHVFSRDGKHLRDVEMGDDCQIAGGVAVAGSLAFGGARDGAMVCVDLDEGDLIWSSEESEEQTFATPVVDSLVVYASDDGFVYAVTRTDGEPVWKFDTEGMPYSPVVAGDKVVAVADGFVFLLNLADGRKLWTKEISDDITSAAIVDGLFVVGADDGTVSAFGKEVAK